MSDNTTDWLDDLDSWVDEDDNGEADVSAPPGDPAGGGTSGVFEALEGLQTSGDSDPSPDGGGSQAPVSDEPSGDAAFDAGGGSMFGVGAGPSADDSPGTDEPLFQTSVDPDGSPVAEPAPEPVSEPYDEPLFGRSADPAPGSAPSSEPVDATVDGIAAYEAPTGQPADEWGEDDWEQAPSADELGSFSATDMWDALDDVNGTQTRPNGGGGHKFVNPPDVDGSAAPAPAPDDTQAAAPGPAPTYRSVPAPGAFSAKGAEGKKSDEAPAPAPTAPQEHDDGAVAGPADDSPEGDAPGENEALPVSDVPRRFSVDGLPSGIRERVDIELAREAPHAVARLAVESGIEETVAQVLAHTYPSKLALMSVHPHELVTHAGLDIDEARALFAYLSFLGEHVPVAGDTPQPDEAAADTELDDHAQPAA